MAPRVAIPQVLKVQQLVKTLLHLLLDTKDLLQVCTTKNHLEFTRSSTSSIRLVQTCPDSSRLVQIWLDLSRLVQTCSEMSGLV